MSDGVVRDGGTGLSDEPLGEGSYVVRHGDDLHSIAFRHGVTPEAIWDHPDNRVLAEVREPNQLLPGDRLHLPPAPERRRHRVAVGQSSRFSVTVPRHEVRLRLRSGGQDHPAERYTAEVDGVVHEGTLDASGELTLPVTPRTRQVVLTLFEEWEHFTHEHRMVLDVGGLDPANSSTGAQARLRALRVDTGRVDGRVGPRTSGALSELQRRHDREATGELDDETLRWLVELHEGEREGD